MEIPLQGQEGPRRLFSAWIGFGRCSICGLDGNSLKTESQQNIGPTFCASCILTLKNVLKPYPSGVMKSFIVTEEMLDSCDNQSPWSRQQSIAGCKTQEFTGENKSVSVKLVDAEGKLLLQSQPYELSSLENTITVVYSAPAPVAPAQEPGNLQPMNIQSFYSEEDKEEIKRLTDENQMLTQRLESVRTNNEHVELEKQKLSEETLILTNLLKSSGTDRSELERKNIELYQENKKYQEKLRNLEESMLNSQNTEKATSLVSSIERALEEYKRA